MPDNQAPAPAQGDDMTLDLCPSMFRSGKTVETVDGEMYKRLTGVHWTTFHFTEVDGMALFEGDIVLSEKVAEARQAFRTKGIGIVGEEFRWPDGIVRYTIADEAIRPLVTAAIAHWENATPLRFQLGDQGDHISFERQNGCWSRVGRVGGKQVISLGPGCGLGAAIHEIGHAIGLWHEQSRSDRDEFITVVTANVIPEFVHNFDKQIQDGTDLGEYDYGSIMHYPPKAFSANGKDTIVARGNEPIGQRNGLSAGDIAAVQMLYPTLAWPANDAAVRR